MNLKTWRHLNFFQHHCYITAPVPRIRCDRHGVKQITVPWARKGSKFTLLFEQAAMILAREMPVLTAARILEVKDKRLWRIIHHYVNQALSRMDLSGLKAFSLDETKSRRGHRYITVFIDLDRKEKPVVFATPGKGRKTLKAFRRFLANHQGNPENVVEVVSDMSGAFISGIKTHFVNSNITVDWFHVVQLFSKAVDEVRRKEAKEVRMPGLRGGLLSRQRKASSRKSSLMRWQSLKPWTCTQLKPGASKSYCAGFAGQRVCGWPDGG